MSSGVISVLVNTPIGTAVDIIVTNNFNGIPVLDKAGILVGILTKYDLIVKRNLLRDDMVVGDVMNNDPLVLDERQTIDDAIRAFSEHHRVDPIPVVDSDRKLLGVISRYDMVRLFKEYGISFYSSFKTPQPSSEQKTNYNLWIIIIGAVILGGLVYYFVL